MKNDFKERWIHGKLRIFEKMKQTELTFSDRTERKSNNLLFLVQTYGLHLKGSFSFLFLEIRVKIYSFISFRTEIKSKILILSFGH